MMESLSQLIDEVKLNEKSEYEYDKPFKFIAVPSSDSLSGTNYESEGYAWTLRIYAVNPPIPEDVFSKLDLHSKAKGKPYFLGWITGTYTKGVKSKDGYKKGGVPAFFVDEIQCDLLQRTFELSTVHGYKKRAYKAIRNVSGELAELVDELEKLEIEFEGSRAYFPLKRKLEIEQRRGEIEDKIGKELQRVGHDPVLPHRAEYKSKLENYFKHWEVAFMKAAIAHARSLECYFMFLIGPTRFAGEFSHIYTGLAKKLGMTKSKSLKDWYMGRVDELINERKVLCERIDPPEQWKSYLETYFRTFMRQEGMNLDDYEEGSFERGECLRHILTFFLDEVQDELLYDENWRREVEQFVLQKYGEDMSGAWPTSAAGTEWTDEDFHELIQDVELDDDE